MQQIKNQGTDTYELEADISTIFCLGLLDVGDLKGKFVKAHICGTL